MTPEANQPLSFREETQSFLYGFDHSHDISATARLQIGIGACAELVSSDQRWQSCTIMLTPGDSESQIRELLGASVEYAVICMHNFLNVKNSRPAVTADHSLALQRMQDYKYNLSHSRLELCLVLKGLLHILDSSIIDY